MKRWRPNHFVIGGDDEFIAYLLMYGEGKAIRAAYKAKYTTDNIIKALMKHELQI